VKSSGGARFHGLLQRWLPGLHSLLAGGFDTIEEIGDWLNTHNDYDVCSFDVFDTLLRRRVDPPETTKAIVAHYISRLLLDHGRSISADELLRERDRAERALQREAVSNGKDGVCFLRDVVEATLAGVKADDLLVWRDIVDYELQVEKTATEPMPGSVELLERLRSRGVRIVGTSDTYLSDEQMVDLLEHQGLLKYIEILYVSSTLGRSKGTGALYRYILEHEKGKIVHIGDDFNLDRVVPSGLGIQTLWLNSGSERRRRRRLAALARARNRMAYVNALVGTADSESGDLYRIGSEVLGPALAVFIHCVAERARENGIDTLFFTARDGYAMKKIYDILRGDLDGGYPDGKYLCLSRIPARLASLDTLKYEDVLEVYRYMVRFGQKDTSLADILSSYGLEPVCFAEVATGLGIDIGERVESPGSERALRILLESDDFQQLTRRKSTEAKNLLADYLAWTGFMGKPSVALVDSNSEGKTQSMLQRAFANDKQYPDVRGYYINLVDVNAHAGPRPDASRLEGVVSDWRTDAGAKHRAFVRFGLLIELFAHPNHGVTVGYKRINGRTIPVFRRTPQESQYPATSQALQGMLAYARDYGRYRILHTYGCEELLEHIRADVLQWITSPPKRDAQALRGLYLVGDWPKESRVNVVEQMKVRDLLSVKSLHRRIESSAWREGTLVLVPVPGLRWLCRTIGQARNRMQGPGSNAPASGAESVR